MGVHIDQLLSPGGVWQMQWLGRHTEEAASVVRQDQSLVVGGDVRAQDGIQRRLNGPARRTGAEQESPRADAAHHGFHAPVQAQAARLEVQVRPALQRRQTITEVRVVRTDQHHWHAEGFRGRPDGGRIAKVHHRHEQRAAAMHGPRHCAERLRIKLGQKPNANHARR